MSELTSTKGHRVPSMHHRSRSYSRAAILGIRIKYWWRWLIQINVHSLASRSPQSSWTLFVFQEKHRVPFFLSSVDSGLAPSTTKDEEGFLITTSDVARIVEFSYLLRFSLYRAKFPFLLRPFNLLALLAPLARPTSVMMNGVAGGGIYPEIQHPGGIY